MPPLSRRGFICRFAATPLLALPALARAQAENKVWRIGYLSTASGSTVFSDAFRDGMRGYGYIEGRNLLIEYRWAAGHVERLPALAAELVRLKVDVIVAGQTEPIVAAQRATSAIPIVMTSASDPLASGLIASLAHPGGNVTGMTFQSTDLAAKDLQLILEFVPKATRVAALGEGKEFNDQLRQAAKKIGVGLVSVQRVTEGQALAAAFAAMRRARAQVLVVRHTFFADLQRQRIVELAAQQRLPAIYGSRGFAEEGGLISYGPNIAQVVRRSAYYVDRILKGAKPADLPVEQPSKFEMVVNLKTARALGIKVPQAVLARADEVIQ